MFCGSFEGKDERTHCCRGNTTVWSAVADDHSSIGSAANGCCFLFHNTSPHICPCRNQEQPCVLPDATQAHQIFRFHQTPCARETENTCKYQSKRCYICARGPAIGSDIRLRVRGRGGTLAPWLEAFGVKKKNASASDIDSTQSEQASITHTHRTESQTARRAAATDRSEQAWPKHQVRAATAAHL